MSDSSYSTSSRSILRCRFLGTQRATHVSWVVEHGWPLSLSYLGESSGSTIDAESDKGTSLNSASLAPKPLASSVYVHVPEARCPHKWSISVMCPFPSLSLTDPRDHARNRRITDRPCAETCSRA